MDVLLWALALFGLWQLTGMLWRRLFSLRFAPPQVSLVFLVKDNQESIEGLIRQLAMECYSFGRCQSPGVVLVVDLGSEDQTPAILRRLARDFSFLHLRQIRAGQLEQVLTGLPQGVLVLDLRFVPPVRALATARHLLRSEVSLRPLPKTKQLDFSP